MNRVKFVLNERRLALLKLHNDHKSQLGAREDVDDLVAAADALSSNADELSAVEESASESESVQKEREDIDAKIEAINRRLERALEGVSSRSQKHEQEVLEAAQKRIKKHRKVPQVETVGVDAASKQ